MKNEISINKYERYIIPIICVCLFIGLFVYFYVVNQVMMFDSDDWTYIGYSRKPWPDLKEWNPGKVFPEVAIPILGHIAAFFYTKLGVSFFTVVSAGTALIIASLWTIYVILLYKILINVVKIEFPLAVLCSVAFFLIHIVIFRTRPNCEFLYNSGNITCFFNYSMPGLICACLVMILILYPDICGGQIKWYKIAFIIAGYFAIFSNLILNIILSSYCFVCLVSNGITSIRKNNRLSSVYRIVNVLIENYVLLAIEIFFAMSLYYESKGGRAKMITDNNSDVMNKAGVAKNGLPIGDTFTELFRKLGSANVIFWFVIALYVGIFFYIQIKNNNLFSDKNYLGVLCNVGFSLGITFIYMILLCSKVSPTYISGDTNIVTILFYVFLVIFLLLGKAFSYIGKSKIPIGVMLLSICILCIPLFNADNHFRLNNSLNLDSSNVKAYNEYLLDEILNAQNNHNTSMQLHVPNIGDESWPFASYGGYRVSNSLHNLGILSDMMDIEVIWDDEISERFNLVSE